jgi:uncharacterized protein (UPF0335 family)|tara:strand:- start:1075 stop:1353 length:279 start_codon:yes stop_codon:yes gene_type:complete
MTTATMTAAAPSDTAGVAGERLKSFIERIERLEEEKKALSEDIREVYAEAKAVGFEPKIMRKMISLRKMELEKRREENELLELYMAAVGMAE